MRPFSLRISPKLVSLLLIAFFLSAAGIGQAAIFDPSARWKTIETPHFRVHHPQRIGDVAKRAARILEEIHPEITAKWNWKPWSYTEVILVDNTDESNGMAAVIPYNWMLIFVVPPDPDSSLAHYDDWLRMLLVHEYTHIVQIDAYGGAWIPIRLIFGKTVSPSGINPTWMREGIAQYDETFFTKGGRGRGSYSEMVVRTSILEETFPPIDVADGLGWRWPGYKTAYIYGIKFVQWLIDTYGEEKFMEFDRRVRSSLLLAMINHQARNVYGQTFYELWNEWKRSLIERYDREVPAVRDRGVTPFEPVVPSNREEQYSVPALSPDGTTLAYSVKSPHGPGQIRLKDMVSGETKVLRKKQAAIQLSWSPDGNKIVYSAIRRYKHFYRYYDLWLYDFGIKKKRKRARRLTSGARARDPDFDPSGHSVVFVAGQAGTDVLKRLDLETKKTKVLTPDVPPLTQFANPRMSPDGRFIAVSVWKPGDGWRIYRYNANGKNPVRLTKGHELVVESRPVWSPDGRHIIFSSDRTGISNLYRVSYRGGRMAQITNVLTGAFQPTLSQSVEGVMAQRYHSKGFEIVRFPIRPKRVGGRKSKASREKTGKSISEKEANETTEGSFESRKYVAFGQSLFLPRFIVPNVVFEEDAIFASLFTGGFDALRWHNWTAGATYWSDPNHFGYHFSYWYNRFKPIFGLSITDYAVDFGNIIFDQDGDPATINDQRIVHFFEHRRNVAPFMAIPFSKFLFNVAYFYEDRMPKTALTPAERAALNLGKFAGFRAQLRYGNAKRYPASISREDGRTVRLTTIVTDSALGSGERNEQVIFAGDWREYVRMFRHHVLALRAAGGMTWGDRLVQGTFGMGGSIGEGVFARGGSYNYFPLRGLPLSALSRTRAMLLSAEYRFPLISPQRGVGTAPFFLKEISGALFADYGNAWNAHEGGSDSFRHFFDDFLLGVGTELRGDFVIGHGLPIHGRLGYAIIVVNRDRLGRLNDPILGTSIKNGMLILALGASF